MRFLHILTERYWSRLFLYHIQNFNISFKSPCFLVAHRTAYSKVLFLLVFCLLSQHMNMQAKKTKALYCNLFCLTKSAGAARSAEGRLGWKKEDLVDQSTITFFVRSLISAKSFVDVTFFRHLEWKEKCAVKPRYVKFFLSYLKLAFFDLIRESSWNGPNYPLLTGIFRFRVYSANLVKIRQQNYVNWKDMLRLSTFRVCDTVTVFDFFEQTFNWQLLHYF